MFRKGDPRPEGAGRKPGQINKRSQELKDLAEKMDCNPFEIMLNIAKGDWAALGYERQTKTVTTKDGSTFEEDIIGVELRGQMAKEAIKYLAPQLKSIEVTGDNIGGQMFVAVDARTLIQTIGKDPMVKQISENSETDKSESFITTEEKIKDEQT